MIRHESQTVINHKFNVIIIRYELQIYDYLLSIDYVYNIVYAW